MEDPTTEKTQGRSAPLSKRNSTMQWHAAGIAGKDEDIEALAV